MIRPDDPYFPSPYRLGEKCPHYVQGGRAVCQSCQGVSIRLHLAESAMAQWLQERPCALSAATEHGLKVADDLIARANRNDGSDEQVLSSSEAVYGFAAWLTTRKTPITMSSSHDAAAVPRLVHTFCEFNKLDEPRENWANVLVHPPERATWPKRTSC